VSTADELAAFYSIELMKGNVMPLLMTVWTFIASHWSDLTGALTTAKLGADTIDSIKKVLPAQLETQQITQDYLEKSKDILNDQSVPIEDKKWELATR
jgi:hypothetical protein